jgi:Flp pilus assembly protein TadD
MATEVSNMRPATRPVVVSLLLAVVAGCASPPFQNQPPSPPAPTQSGRGPTLPTVPPPGSATEPVIDAPTPTPLPKERPKVTPATLSPASQALVTQAQAQRKRGDLPGATVSLERALRIEPRNPLVWIEMGRLRMDQRNFPQAEAMARKALSMSIGDDRTQSQAWLLVADSLRARGRNVEAQEAIERSKELAPT